MPFSTGNKFLHKWLAKLKTTLRQQFSPVEVGEKTEERREDQVAISLQIAKVLNLLNYPLFWAGILLAGWLFLEFILEFFLLSAFLAPIQRYSKPLVAVLGPAVVGYWTNLLAIKMLFHPQRQNAVWWGLIHARRENLISSLAAGLQSAVISPEIIRNYLSDQSVLTKLTTGLAQALDEVIKDPEFRSDFEELIANLLATILSDPRTKAQLDRYLEAIIEDWNGSGFGGKVLEWTKDLWGTAFRKKVWAILAELPERLDYLTPQILVYLESLPAKLEAEAETVEPLATELITDGLRRIDFQNVIQGQLAKMDPTALERLLTSNIMDELVFIQTSGGIFGFLVGLAILYPILRPVFLLGGLILWAIYHRTVEKK
ncbi:MAG TPA: DUF445 family protein [Firmicutes bacterium]|jgi:uncharacterized membrane-anchored protein YjiN (DUF445 family)|nr:DUF445 family protein [Bacillota bacterium]